MAPNNIAQDNLLATKATNFHGIFGMEKNGVKVNRIVIPIIQRDYAQGRLSPEVNRIRERFLQVLYDALASDKKTTLDFIYGKVDENGNLIPLDGQQRLTTLFLLHYYISKHEVISDVDCSFIKNFTYETRISSRKFCEHLVEFTPSFTNNSFSDQIRDEAWFLMEWENDPTVQSMLVMLDAIHKKFVQTSGLWPKLMHDNISFFFLPLSEIGGTDDLYIKMNSRGKALTHFEHFKAEFELRTKELDTVISKRLITKIDREWTDLLWPFRNSETGDQQFDEITDDEFIRYIRFISAIIQYKNGEAELTDDFTIIEKLFSKDCPSAMENLNLLEKMFDVWKGLDIESFFDNYISSNGYAKDKIWLDGPKNLFRECCKSYGIKITENRYAFSLVQTILLYSFILYLCNKDTLTDADFRRRIRIVSNLAKNSPDTIRSENMKKLLAHVDKVILFGVVEKSTGRARFQTKQVEEEIKKLLFTNEHPEMAEKLFRLEDHPYLNGYISSIGLEHVEWCERFYNLFSKDLHKVNRALLATNDYFVKDAWRFQIGTADKRLATSVWRDILGPVKLQDNFRQTLQSLLSKDVKFSENFLDNIAWKYLQNSREMPVRYYLVKYSQMLPNRWGKYYWRKHWEKGRNSYDVLMMMTEISISGYNYDIFLKTLYEIAGGAKKGLELGNYSYSMYNNEGADKLYLRNQKLYLTLLDNTYTMYRDNGEIIDSQIIPQNENGIDTEDRILIGLRMLNNYMGLYSFEKVRSYINRCEWQYAKTMPQWPHDYIVRNKCPLNDDEFNDFVWSQRVLGEYAVWGNYRQPYIHIDGYKYWTMGCEIESTTVINRAKE